MRTERQADLTKLIVAYRNFVNPRSKKNTNLIPTELIREI